MFLFMFIQKCDPSLSRAYCVFAQPTKSNVLGKLATHDLNNWVTWKLVDLAKI
jgi:hypothetical protein